jgi:hypothetical protein
MRLNPWDALMFQRMLAKDQELPEPGLRDHRLALYHLGLKNITQQSSDPIAIDELEQNQIFQLLKTQSKFFNGALKYSKEEWKLLEEWVQKTDKEKLQQFFLHVVLANKPTTAGRYPKSKLSRFLSSFQYKKEK